ncbi:DUF1289 domain-containing protein [Planctomycetes bacterium K23_9]|uniref:DUF1289 domain-containing protein n=1 Tax=Stieleria marina TaxID=1930275 RepID=UPI0011A2FDD6
MPDLNSPLEPLDDDDVASPCIKHCVVDLSGICVGCHRSLDEIATWGTSSARTRRDVLERCNQRQQASRPGNSSPGNDGQRNADTETCD